MRYWRTIGLVIPCQVASPQSLTPFHQAGRSVTRIMKKKRSPSDKVVVSSNTATKLPKERPMNLLKYIGMDVHKATTVVMSHNTHYGSEHFVRVILRRPE